MEGEGGRLEGVGTGDGVWLGVGGGEEFKLTDWLGGVKGMAGKCLLGEEVCSEPEESDSLSLLEDGGGGGSRGTGDADSGGRGPVSGFMSSRSRASS